MREDGLTSRWTIGRLQGAAEIPSGWQLERLVDVSTLESGHTPARTNPTYWDGDIPWVSLHDTSALSFGEIFDTKLMVTNEGISNSSARVLPKGTVALSRTATVGKAASFGRKMATSQDFACFLPSERVETRYLLHLFRSMAPEWRRLSAGSTHQTIYMPVFKRLQVLLPPLEEQRRIAEILDTVDEAIQAAEQVLAKRRMLRIALVRDQVRPESGAEPGALRPAGWVDVRIGDAVRQHVEPVRIEDDQEYHLISIRRRHGGIFHRESLPGAAILDKRMQRVVPGTFVIARRQIVHGACALATSEFAESVMSMSYSAFVGTPICDVRFFFVLAQTPPMIKQFWDASHGVVVEKLNFQQEEWLNYRIQLPPIEFQRRVVSAVEASDAEISALEHELEALRGVREGLASDLLSGRVRTVAT